MDLSQTIAQALKRVKQTTKSRGVDILRTEELSRSDRELLLRTSWLQEVMKGWYMLVRPDTAEGDSAAWFANFWDFVRVYLTYRFKNKYCLSASASLALITEVSSIPRQITVIAQKGGANTHSLMHDTSILMYEDVKNFPSDIIACKQIQCMSLPLALCKIAPTYFFQEAENAEIALRQIEQPSELSKVIIQHGFKAAASRLIGAYQFLGEDGFANQLQSDIEIAGIFVKPVNPFKHGTPLTQASLKRSPYYSRIKAIWSECRGDIISIFPSEPGLQTDVSKALADIEDVYVDDAYNSLSIEGYVVSDELIEKVRSKQWNPDLNLADADSKNALAARGYHEAFLAVKKSLKDILSHQDAGTVIKHDLQSWYQGLFKPCAQAGILPVESLMGYRNDRVHIRGSRHVPPPKSAILDAMEAFYDCLINEESAAVRAVLGHYLFVYIHPHMDGNGRMSRFLMNAMLVSGGYSWVVIENSKRKQYMQALRVADEQRDLKPFASLVAQSLKGLER